jgi:hypothetical protein
MRRGCIADPIEPGTPLLRHPTWRFITCPKCGGKGKTFKTKCPHCSGSKLVMEEKKLEAVVERGMPDGHKLVFSDQVAASAGRLQHPVAVFTHPPHASPKRSASLNAALPTWAEADGGEARDLRVLLLMARVPKSVRVQP